MVNLLDSSGRATIVMTDIGKTDERLSQKIQDLMFVFDDLHRDRRSRHAGTAAPGAGRQAAASRSRARTRRFKAKVFKNMSQRAAEMMKDDLEAKGPVRLSDVEAAQKEILLAARKLADEGTIPLGGKGERVCLSRLADDATCRAGTCPRSKARRCRAPARGVNVMHLDAVERDAWEHGYKAGHVEGVRKGEAELARRIAEVRREDRGARGHHRHARQAARGARHRHRRPSSRGSR